MIAIKILTKYSGSPMDSHYTFTSAQTTWPPVSIKVKLIHCFSLSVCLPLVLCCGGEVEAGGVTGELLDGQEGGGGTVAAGLPGGRHGLKCGQPDISP